MADRSHGMRRLAWKGVRRAANSVIHMDNRGATLIEFAIVAPMLLLLMTTIIDLGIMLTTQSLLDGAARDAARLIRTGQVSTSGNPISTFQTLLCSKLSPIMSTATCQSKVIFDVEVFPDFGDVSFKPCTLNNNQTGTGTVCKFSSGGSTDIVGVQVTYNRTFIVPWVGACLTGGSCWTGTGSAIGTKPGANSVPLVSTVVFKNEPFPASSPAS
ncbi:MAG TPA: TadE/TadG family type IV pilus assembly protein [Stellaceae bacterium]|nr:TadE/TadG family type IV pilus assembly protein [Stellaceae bacterium]